MRESSAATMTMRRRPLLAIRLSVLAAAALTTTLAMAPASAAPPLTAKFLYNLADFSGTVPCSNPRLHVDRRHDEIYVAEGNTVRIFNATGMQIFEFGHDQALGVILDVATDETGSILTLSYDYRDPSVPTWAIVKSSYRGEPESRISAQGLPEELAAFHPNRMFYRDARFLLLSETQMMAVRLDGTGAFETWYDLKKLASVPERNLDSTEVVGASLTPTGDLLFTVPTLFKAFVLSPDGTIRDFGQAGSGPGKFGIVSGITVDDHGNYLVTDRLRWVVLVFDPELRFRNEFGGGLIGEGGLFYPSSPAVGNQGRLYVTQSGGRGVPVFTLAMAGGAPHAEVPLGSTEREANEDSPPAGGKRDLQNAPEASAPSTTKEDVRP